jgi:hypothetical protein
MKSFNAPGESCLEEVMEVWLLHAAHMKAVPGRKSDIRDAEWIAQLLEHGLLAPSFVPPPDISSNRTMQRALHGNCRYVRDSAHGVGMFPR